MPLVQGIDGQPPIEGRPAEAGERAAAQPLQQRRLRFLGVALNRLLGLLGTAMLLSAAGRSLGVDGSQATTVQGVVALCGLVLLVAAIRRSGLGLLAAAERPAGRSRLIQAIGLFPFPAMGAFVIYRLGVTDIEAYQPLVSEGSLVEWLSFLLFLAAGVIGLLSARAEWRSGQALLAGVFLGFALLCLFVGLEEMSWGQTIFNWDTPELFNEVNAQKETNLHNHVGFKDKLWASTAAAFLVITLLIPLRWLLQRQGWLRSWSAVDAALPVGCLIGYFLLATAIYIPVALEKGGLDVPVLVTRDQEVAELLFALGVLLHACRNYLHRAAPIRSKTRLSPAAAQR